MSRRVQAHRVRGRRRGRAPWGYEPVRLVLLWTEEGPAPGSSLGGPWALALLLLALLLLTLLLLALAGWWAPVLDGLGR